MISENTTQDRNRGFTLGKKRVCEHLFITDSNFAPPPKPGYLLTARTHIWRHAYISSRAVRLFNKAVVQILGLQRRPCYSDKKVHRWKQVQHLLMTQHEMLHCWECGWIKINFLSVYQQWVQAQGSTADLKKAWCSTASFHRRLAIFKLVSL